MNNSSRNSKIQVTDEEYEQAAKLSSVKKIQYKNIARKIMIILIIIFCFIVSCFTYMGIEDYLSEVFAAPLSLLVFFALVNLTTKRFTELWE